MRIMLLGQSPMRPDEPERYKRLRAELPALASPGTTIELHYPEDFPGARVFEKLGAQNALTGLHHQLEIAALVRKAVWAQEQGFDAVVQQNTFDPGVEASRLAVGIPVIGQFRTALAVASTLGDRIGVLVPLEGHIPEARALVRGYGMSGAVADIAPLGEYGRVRDLGARREALTELMAAAVRDQVARVGVDVVIPLGGALIPEIVDPHEVRGRAGIPVLNLKRLAIRHAETCVELGIVHSPATYPRVDLTLADYSAYAFRTSE